MGAGGAGTSCCSRSARGPLLLAGGSYQAVVTAFTPPP
jgi:hypothetical protein